MNTTAPENLKMSGKHCKWMAIVAATVLLLGLNEGFAAEKDYMAALQLLKIDGDMKAPDFELPAVNFIQTVSENGENKSQDKTQEVTTEIGETGETKVTGSWEKILKWAQQRWGTEESADEREGLEKINLSDYRGSVVFLNFWATWCPPCREEMPDIEKLNKGLQGTNFAILAISIDVSGTKAVRPFMKELGLTFPALLDPNRRVARKYGVISLPTTFLIDCSGSLVAKAIGPRKWDDGNALELIKRLQAEPRCKG